MQFLKYILATVIGLFLFFLIGFFFILTLASLSGGDTVDIKSDAVLKIDLNQQLVERVEQEDPFAELDLGPVSGVKQIGLVELKEAIRNAQVDDRVKGILLDGGIAPASFAQLREIRKALQAFKDSGKFIINYSYFLSESGYYTASVSDEIYVHPSGGMEFNGLSATAVFFTDMFDKIGVKPEIFRVGEFKSAVEPFLRNSMSEENRLQTRVYLDTLHQVMLREISAANGLPLNLLEELSDEGTVMMPSDAAANKLISNTAHRDEVMEKVRSRLGLEAGADINFVSLSDFQKAEPAYVRPFSSNKIEVIIVDGTIMPGTGGDGIVGGEEIAKAVREARKDSRVKAIVLRINSPGGSVLASDMMHRELLLAAEEKPLIASMSGVAASAGYQIAAVCDTIVAHPNTITGSIGVLLTLFTAEELLNDKIGLSFDYVETGELSNFGNLDKPFSETERMLLQKQVDTFYEGFISDVANGRGLPTDSIAALAGGRVWSGADAKRLGLVDVLGDMEAAIEIAANSAGIGGDYRLSYFPKKKDFLAALLDKGESSMKAKWLQEELGETYPYYQQLQHLRQLEGVQAIMPFQLKIR